MRHENTSNRRLLELLGGGLLGITAGNLESIVIRP
jgi:hypothetical protein